MGWCASRKLEVAVQLVRTTWIWQWHAAWGPCTARALKTCSSRAVADIVWKLLAPAAETRRLNCRPCVFLLFIPFDARKQSSNQNDKVRTQKACRGDNYYKVFFFLYTSNCTTRSPKHQVFKGGQRRKQCWHRGLPVGALFVRFIHYNKQKGDFGNAPPVIMTQRSNNVLIFSQRLKLHTGIQEALSPLCLCCAWRQVLLCQGRDVCASGVNCWWRRNKWIW